MKSNPFQTLIFLPGWGFSAHMWEDVGALINNNKSYLTKYIELSDADTMQPFPEGSIFIAWSLGGLLAIKQCLLYPNRYQKLILINSAAYFSKFTTDYKNIAENNLDHFQSLFLRWVFYPSHPKKITYWDKYFLGLIQENRSLLLQQLSFLFETDLRDEYKKLTLPILRIQGVRDAVVANESRYNESHEKVQVLSGGHALPFTHTMELSEIIRDFL